MKDISIHTLAYQFLVHKKKPHLLYVINEILIYFHIHLSLEVFTGRCHVRGLPFTVCASAQAQDQVERGLLAVTPTGKQKYV